MQSYRCASLELQAARTKGANVRPGSAYDCFCKDLPVIVAQLTDFIQRQQAAFKKADAE